MFPVNFRKFCITNHKFN